MNAYLYECSSSHNGTDEEKELYNITYKTHEFINNHIWAISLIHSLVPTAYIGSFTAPNIKKGMHLFHYYANAMRYLSHKYGTFLYDWNLLLISHNKDVYLRDRLHPARPYSTSFGGTTCTTCIYAYHLYTIFDMYTLLVHTLSFICLLYYVYRDTST